MLVNPSSVVGFLLLSMFLSAIPGPSVLLETSRAITRGRRSAMWIVLGNALGGLVLLALVLAGLGAIVATSARLFMVLKIAGALYLLWLGIESIRSARSGHDDGLEVVADTEPESASWSIRRGFAAGVANPKSIISLMAVLPQFVDHRLGHTTMQMLIIGVVGGIAQVLIETVWVWAAGSLRAWFGRRPNRIRRLKGGGGIVMIGLAGRLAVDR